MVDGQQIPLFFWLIFHDGWVVRLRRQDLWREVSVKYDDRKDSKAATGHVLDFVILSMQG